MTKTLLSVLQNHLNHLYDDISIFLSSTSSACVSNIFRAQPSSLDSTLSVFLHKLLPLESPAPVGWEFLSHLLVAICAWLQTHHYLVIQYLFCLCPLSLVCTYCTSIPIIYNACNLAMFFQVLLYQPTSASCSHLVDDPE